MVRIIVFLSFLLSYSCRQEAPGAKNYLFLGHIYQWGVTDNNRIDYRFEDYDFSVWDQIWLGGDLCARTTEYQETVEYLDSIFDLDSPQTHWTLGNHDTNHKNLDWILEKTGRNSYYTTSFDGICLVVLNTTEFYHPNYQPTEKECQLLDGQLEMLQNLADTLQNASHCIVLHHNALLTSEMTGDSIDIGKVFNFYRPELKTGCVQAETFEKTIYPILEDIQQKGIQVVLIGGDLGQRAKSFEYRTTEGITFLGSGINNSALAPNMPAYVTDTSPDKLLIFKHLPKQQKLSWEFVEMNALLNKKSSAE